MRDVLSVISCTFLALAAWTATVSPSQAETGTVRVVFGAAGVVAGIGNGQGTLTLHGKTYPFEVSQCLSGSWGGHETARLHQGDCGLDHCAAFRGGARQPSVLVIGLLDCRRPATSRNPWPRSVEMQCGTHAMNPR